VRTYVRAERRRERARLRLKGNEEAAKVAKQSLAERKTIRQVVIERGYVEQGKLTEQQLDAALDVLSMTHP
jgi:fumarate hydratase class II